LKSLTQPFFGRADAEVQHTTHEESLESQLVAALDDLEYMRGVALSNEADRNAETTTAEKQPAILRSRKLPTASLAEASKQLNEVISRHKKEVEQLTRERVSLCEIEPMSHFATRIQHLTLILSSFLSTVPLAARHSFQAQQVCQLVQRSE
jgi:hypothetical protein